MKISDAVYQNRIKDVLNLGDTKSAEFLLSEDSFKPVLVNPNVSRLLGEVVKMNGVRVQHFYIAPKTIRPSKIVMNAMDSLRQSSRGRVSTFSYFRTPAFIVRAQVRARSVSYGDFSFFPIGEPTSDIWNAYYKFGTIHNLRGDILMNNTYAETSGNWCFGHLRMEHLYDETQKVDGFYGVHAIESIIINFLNATPNNDLGYLYSDTQDKLEEIGVSNVRNWGTREAQFGFWLAQDNWLNEKHPEIDPKVNSKELQSALDTFWKVWIPKHRGGRI